MRRRLLLAVSLSLLAAACGGGEVAQQPGPTAPASPAATAGAPPGTPTATAGDVPEGLQFTADLVEGGQLDGGDLAGRDVVLWFWAPW